MNFQDFLTEKRACKPAREWATGKTMAEAWETCRRADWLLWLAKKRGVNLRLITLAKARCAETVLHLMQDERSKKAVTVALAYGEGMATDEELDAAAEAADAAFSAEVADAAAFAAFAAADAGYATYAATATANAHAEATGYATVERARAAHLSTLADIVRSAIKFSDL